MPRIVFISADGEEQAEFTAKNGLSILEIAHEEGIDIEGACGGAMACSTCHVLIQGDFQSKLPPPSEEEEDMLDITYGVQTNSRLGCQLIVTEGLDGLTVKLPPKTHNIQGF